MSVIEYVRIAAVDDRGDELGQRLQRGLKVHAADPGCVAAQLHRSIERPNEYLLEIHWKSVEAHHLWRDHHRDEWRAAVGWEIVDGGPMGLGHYRHHATVKEA